MEKQPSHDLVPTPLDRIGNTNSSVRIDKLTLDRFLKQHRELLLEEAFGPVDHEVLESQNSRFAGLLAKLENALEAQSRRDERTFRSEFLTMVPRLHKFAMSLTRNPSAADDLVQDTLLRGWRSQDHFVVGTSLGAWLFQIMRNAFYSHHRKMGREVADSDGSYAARLTAAPEQSGHLDLKDAGTALAKLAPGMRQALLLVTVENLSYEETAAIMGCQIGTVKSRVWRARQQLAALLGYSGVEVGNDSVVLSAMYDPSDVVA